MMGFWMAMLLRELELGETELGTSILLSTDHAAVVTRLAARLGANGVLPNCRDIRSWQRPGHQGPLSINPGIETVPRREIRTER